MKVGVVGYGSIGKRHAANIEALGHKVLVYDPAQRADVKYERIIYDSCDAVVVATPSPYHEGCVRAAIERGKHVLVEKPISVAVGALPELLAMAELKKLTVMMGNNLRFHPCVIETRNWINAGMIGRTLLATFTCAFESTKAPYLNDGVLLNTGAHEVDLALHLFGPARVLAASGDGISIIDFVLQHDKGVRSVIHLDFVSPIEVREFRITGLDGDIYCDLPERFLARRQLDSKLPGVIHKKGFNNLGSYGEDYLEEMRVFIERAQDNDGTQGLPGASGFEGLDTLRLLLDVRKMAGMA